MKYSWQGSQARDRFRSCQQIGVIHELKESHRQGRGFGGSEADGETVEACRSLRASIRLSPDGHLMASLRPESGWKIA
jgi:hypothetical protein